MSQNLTLHIRGEVSASWCASLGAMCLVALMTVVGNSAVLAALGRLRRAPSHYPLASLALADLLLGLFVLPIAVARELFVFRLNWAVCSCWSTLDVLCCTASILSLCVLGWERWSGITAPLSRARRAHLARKYAALVWPVAALVALPTGLVPSQRQDSGITMACTVNTNVAYVFFSTFFSFYLPAVVMVTVYARILLALAALPQIRSHRGRTPSRNEQDKKPDGVSKCDSPNVASVLNKNLKNSVLSPKGCYLNVPCGTRSPAIKVSSNSPKGFFSKQHRATRTIVTLMSLFLLCWTPFFIMLPIDSLCQCANHHIWWWCSWLGYGNSSLNPLVYAAASPSVRRALISSARTVHSPARL